MFEKNKLYQIDGSGIIFVEVEKSEFDNLLNLYRLDEDKKNVVVLLRGAKMKSVESMFAEFASSLQFPSYFGENWNSFDECINDLDWLPGDNYILGINDIQDLLVNENKKKLSFLIEILNKACQEWGMPKDIGKEWGREAKPFHFLLQYNERNENLVKKRFSEYLEE